MDYPKSVPSVGLVGGKFVDEDTATGVQGSLIPSAWGNGVTDELLNVIKAAGLVPDEENNAQLLAAIKAVVVSPGVSPGRLIRIQVISTTQVPSYHTDTKSILVELFGGGGGGGGCAATGSGQASGGSPGSGGGYSKKRLAAGFVGVLITIGAGGAVAFASNGSNGGVTSFGSIFSATGGTGGSAQGAVSSFPAFVGTNPPGYGVGGDINGTGEWAQPTLLFSSASAFQNVGNSGSSRMGWGVRVPSDTAAISATMGAGGSGVARSANLGSLPGGFGGQGFAIIYEYA
ncbi:hypothetical protein ALP94_04612 [Pseudomonas savastanoi pv. glycinea]|nr:hypothetical protein ALP94_04612 [Pseudomonas savastanoi pv. glycinea]